MRPSTQSLATGKRYQEVRHGTLIRNSCSAFILIQLRHYSYSQYSDNEVPSLSEGEGLYYHIVKLKQLLHLFSTTESRFLI